MWFFTFGYMLIFIIAPIYMFVVWVIRFTIIDMLVYSAIWLLAQVGIKIKMYKYMYLFVNVAVVFRYSYIRGQMQGGDAMGWFWLFAGLFTLAFTFPVWSLPDYSNSQTTSTVPPLYNHLCELSQRSKILQEKQRKKEQGG